MFIQNNKTVANKVVFYFHGNGEDIGYSHYFLEPIMEEWEAHAVAIEYPTYGLYTSPKVSLDEGQFSEDAQVVYDHVSKTLGIHPNQTIVFGRSIGSGPSTLLAYHRQPAAFFLFSPLKSINEVAKDKVGFLVAIAAPRFFKNIDLIDKINSPTFIIHGKKDEVIDHKHGHDLFQKSKVDEQRKQLHLVENMGHNRFELYTDFILPSKEFLRRQKLVGQGKMGPAPISNEEIGKLFCVPPPTDLLEEWNDKSSGS